MPESVANFLQPQARTLRRFVNPQLVAGIASAARAVASRLTAAMAAGVIMATVALVPAALADSMAAGSATAAALMGPGNTGCCGET